MFGETATVYHFDGEAWTRTVLRGVFVKKERALEQDGGGLKRDRCAVRMRVPKGGYEECPVRVGDVLVCGEGPVIGGGYTMAQLRNEEESACAVESVADNTARPRLRHWRIEAR